MVNKVTSSWVRADQIFERVPFISTITSIINLFHKCITIPIKGKLSVKDYYFTYLNQKSFSRCVVLLIPVLGNIIVGIYDSLNKQSVGLSKTTHNGNAPRRPRPSAVVTNPAILTGQPVTQGTDQTEPNPVSAPAQQNTSPQPLPRTSPQPLPRTSPVRRLSFSESTVTGTTDTNESAQSPAAVSESSEHSAAPSSVYDSASVVAELPSAPSTPRGQGIKSQLAYTPLNKSDAEVKKMIEQIENHGNESSLQDMPIWIIDDFEFVHAAVKKDARSIKDASERLKGDETIMSIVVKQDGRLIRHGSDDIKGNINIARLALQSNPEAYRHLSKTLREDENLARDAFFRNGLLIQHSEPAIRDHLNLAKQAINQNVGAYQYLSDRLKADPDIGVSVCLNKAIMFKQLPESLRDNIQVVEAATQRQPDLLKFAGPNAKKDFSLILGVVLNEGLALRFADVTARAEEDLVKPAVRQNGLALAFADEKLRDKEEVVRLAVGQNGLALEFVSKRLREDKKIVSIAVSKNKDAFNHALGAAKNDPTIRQKAGLPPVESKRKAPPKGGIRVLPAGVV